MSVSYDKLFIGGEWVSPSSAARIAVRNASTEEPIGEAPEAAEADVDAAVAAARRAFDDPSGWSQWERAQRAAAMERLAAELEARAQEIGRLVSEQNGMPITLSPLIEGMTPVGTLRYMASLLADVLVEEDRPRFLGGDLIIRHEPVGVVGGIVPWNYPQTLASFKYAPAMAAGCTIVLKPSPETVRSSSTTPTWTWPGSGRTCSLPRWSTTGRPATPEPGSWRRAPATTRSLTPSPRSPRRCRSATPSTRRP